MVVSDPKAKVDKGDKGDKVAALEELEQEMSNNIAVFEAFK
jgi:hypothetical protein